MHSKARCATHPERRGRFEKRFLLILGFGERGRFGGPYPWGERSNLQDLKNILESSGWIVIVWHLSPEDFGVPTSRPRLWISCVPRLAIEWAGYKDVDSFRRDMYDLMDRFVGFTEAPLGLYLLPEDSPLVLEYLAECN